MLIATTLEQGSHTLFHAPEAVHGEAYAKCLWKGCEVHVLYGHHESRLGFGYGVAPDLPILWRGGELAN